MFLPPYIRKDGNPHKRERAKRLISFTAVIIAVGLMLYPNLQPNPQQAAFLSPQKVTELDAIDRCAADTMKIVDNVAAEDAKAVCSALLQSQDASASTIAAVVLQSRQLQQEIRQIRDQLNARDHQ